MKKMFLFLGITLMGIGLCGATETNGKVKVTTSCDKVVYLESSDYKNSEDMMKDVESIDKALCPETIPFD